MYSDESLIKQMFNRVVYDWRIDPNDKELQEVGGYEIVETLMNEKESENKNLKNE